MSDDPALTAAILERSRQWMAAWQAQDRAALEAILAHDYALIIASAPAERIGRARWIEIGVGPFVCARFDYRDVQVRRMTDDLVVMSAVLEVDATMDGVDRPGPFFVTDLWRDEAGEWKVCARFSSPLFDDSDSIGRMTADA